MVTGGRKTWLPTFQPCYLPLNSSSCEQFASILESGLLHSSLPPSPSKVEKCVLEIHGILISALGRAVGGKFTWINLGNYFKQINLGNYFKQNYTLKILQVFLEFIKFIWFWNLFFFPLGVSGKWMASSVPWNTLWEMLFQYEVMAFFVSGF